MQLGPVPKRGEDGAGIVGREVQTAEPDVRDIDLERPQARKFVRLGGGMIELEEGSVRRAKAKSTTVVTGTDKRDLWKTVPLRGHDAAVEKAGARH